jgi:uncharacterized protein
VSEPSPLPPSGAVPVFPLPGVVLFPRTVLPLHIFEPRYRTMIHDAVAGEGLVAMALLKPGWEASYEGSPPIHPVGTVGRVEDLEPLSDGRFLLRLVGVARVAFGAAERTAPYRVLRVRVIPETPVDESDPSVRTAKLDLLTSHGCLMRELLPGEPTPGMIFDDRVSFEAAVNGACFTLPLEPGVRQRLLEEDDLLERHRRVSVLLDEVLERILKLKAMRGRDEGGPGFN